MTKLYSTKQIRQAETEAIASGIDEILLMYRAACGIMNALPPVNRSIGILCGKGNNAGDGYALATLCAQNGGRAVLYCFSDRLTPAASHYYELCKKLGIPMRTELDEIPFRECDLLVDCLFGTGFHGEVTSPFREVIEAANASGLPIVSADIPSGLSADNGIASLAIHATQTVAIGGYKYGHLLGQGRDLCGELSVCDIGIHPDSSTALIDNEDLQSIFAPRPNHCHKGTFGTVTLLGGSLPYSGAPRLASLAAASLRSGCGIARLAIPACLANSALPYLLESTLYPMPHKNGALIYDTDALESAFKGATSAAIGMGMNRSVDNPYILSWALKELSIPLVIDADGINTLAEMDLSLISRSDCKVILTPHPKEFSRLSKNPMNEIMSHPIEHARSFAQAYGCILLLKGTSTIVTDGNETLVIARGSGGMATAGSGDVLSGVIASMTSWSQENLLLTVAAGAYLCGVAGEIAAHKVGTISMIASDTVAAIPEAILKITHK